MKMKIKLLVVLWATVMSVTYAMATSTCASLPMQTLNFKRLARQSPFRVVFSPMAPSFACASVLYTRPTPGSSGYDLACTYINKTSVMANYQLTLAGNDEDDSVKACSTGNIAPSHLFLKMNIRQEKGFCIFTCSTDGTSMTDIKCLGRGGGLDATALSDVLTTISGVPGAPTSANAALANCTQPQYCDYFD